MKLQENMFLQSNEVIKSIQEYEGLYSITSFGRVWSHERKVIYKNGNFRMCGNNFLKPGFKNKGYLHVTLFKGGNKRTKDIHRLVAQQFIPNPLNLPEVNHKDTNKQNNHKDNLEWCTEQENSNHKVKINNSNKRKSKYYGVCFCLSITGRNKWVSYVTVGGKQKNIAYSSSEIEAANKYNKYVIIYCLNRPLNDI